MGIDHQKELATFLGSRLVSYNVCLSKVLGGITASIFLNQLLYWSGKSENPDWIYKKVAESQEETGLTSDQQLTAQKKLVALGIIEVKKKGIPPIRRFKINYERLYKVCSDFVNKQGKQSINYLKNSQLNNGKSAKYIQ